MQLVYRERRKKRHERIRKSIFGTSERPRLCIFKSEKHLYAQLIDDYQKKTLLTFSTLSEKFRKASPKGNTVEAAKKLGELFGGELKVKGFQKIVFDRGGYKYHGKVKALADALRKTGVNF
ncbi:MAG: 50S ribosomal protein L18 [Candidatus Omnitrophica bacterium]|nr:50S ribosomal protein L18 [Candidatus Omnitrophota bacterium]